MIFSNTCIHKGIGMKTVLLLIAMLGLMAGGLLADSVHLKNGSVLQGKIISQEPGVSYKLKTLTGDIQVIKQEDVENIEYGPVQNTGKKKSEAVAIVLSLLWAGTGNIYAGDMKRGAVLIGGDALGVIVAISGASGGNTGATTLGNLIMLGSKIAGCITSYGAVSKANQTANAFEMNDPMSDVSLMSSIRKDCGYANRTEVTLLRLNY